MILDCHTHIFPAEMIRDRDALCIKDRGFAAIYENSKARMVGVEDLLSSMDDSGIDRSVICGFSWGRSDLCFHHNQYLLESASRYPERLIVFVSFFPLDPERSLLELEKGIKAGAKGVGEIAFYDRGMGPRAMESMRPALTALEEKNIPLLLHTNETIGHSYPGKGETPLSRFHELILTYPRLRVILAHWEVDSSSMNSCLRSRRRWRGFTTTQPLLLFSIHPRFTPSRQKSLDRIESFSDRTIP